MLVLFLVGAAWIVLAVILGLGVRCWLEPVSEPVPDLHACGDVPGCCDLCDRPGRITTHTWCHGCLYESFLCDDCFHDDLELSAKQPLIW